MAEDEEPDVIINIHKGLDGYGIFFAQREEGMVVTKLDKGSEAEKAGVQPGDRLVRVQDNDGKLPMNAPGRDSRMCTSAGVTMHASPTHEGSTSSTRLSLLGGVIRRVRRRGCAARAGWDALVPGARRWWRGGVLP